VRFRPTLVVLTVGLAGMTLLAAWSPVRAGVEETARLLATGDLAAIRDHLRGFGPWAPIVSFGLIQLQAVVAPLPSFPVIYANGLLFGTRWGGFLSWSSVLASAALCFGLARLWGRPLVSRLVSPAGLSRADAVFERYGVYAVLLGRLLPITAFDLLSYAAGLTPMRLGPFLVATALGMTPATLLMAAAGDLGGRALGPLIGTALGIAALGGAAVWLVRRFQPPRLRVLPALQTPAADAEP
jgi:uncharacterized membrane protein YdjX (TVP38/TMEM64 family)